MTTETTEYPAVKYDITEARVAELRQKYEGLTIKGPTDKGGLALVRTGRLECKGIRVAIDKRRKQYNSGALDFTRTVNAKAKEATAPVLLLETSLKAEEDRIKAEIAEIKTAKEKEEDRLQRRVDLLQRFGKQLSIVNLKAMSDDEFQVVYDEAKAEHEAEEARLAKEAEEKAAQKEEAERLENEAKEEADRIEREAKEEEDRLAREAEETRLAVIAKEQEAKAEELRLEKEQIDKEQAEIQVENDRLEAERQAIATEKKVEAAKKEAADLATKEAEEKAKREADEKAEADRKKEEEAVRQEALRPDKDRLETFAQMLVDLPGPELKTEEGKEVLAKAEDQILDVVATLRIGIKTM